MIRAATHVHTDWSYDGSWELEALVAELKRRGYGAVLTAEHDRTFDPERWQRYREACAAAAAAVGIPVVAGIEYSDADNVVHVPVWGVDTPFLGAGRPSDELIAAAAAAGAVAVLAHPGRKDAWRRLDPGSFAALAGVEVWNRKYDGWAPGPVGTELAARHSLTPFSGSISTPSASSSRWRWASTPRPAPRRRSWSRPCGRGAVGRSPSAAKGRVSWAAPGGAPPGRRRVPAGRPDRR